MVTPTTIGLGAVKMIAGAGLSTIMQDRNNRQAQEMAARDRAENYRYGEMAAENAYARQIEMTENYMTPEAQVAHLRAAGLSPSLMYGAGGSTQGTSSPMGTGASGVQTQYNALKMQDMLAMSELANIQAQTRKTNAEADTEEGLNKRGEEEINKIVAETAGQEALTAKTKAETELTNIDVEIKDKSKEDVLFTIKQKADEAFENAQFAALKVAEKVIDLEIKQSTMQDLITQCKTKTIQMANELVLQRKEVELKEAQIKEITNHIAQKWQELSISKGELNLKNQIFKLDKSKFKFEQFKFNKSMSFELEKFNKGIEFEAHKQKVIAITELMTKFGTALLYGGIIKNTAQGIITPKTQFAPTIKMQDIIIPTNQYTGLIK